MISRQTALRKLTEGWNEEEIFEVANDSVQPSICLTCGEEGVDVEPDCFNGTCDMCGSRTLCSLLGVLL